MVDTTRRIGALEAQHPNTTAARAVPPERSPPLPGAMRRVVSGRRVQVEMLGADGSWSPVFCYNEPPADGQDNASSSR